ncbi:LPS export ABC transporter ATP-binding protein [Parvularcula lutaonensis]|uniref:Lipopolysaccharide export system ATP-binding protein LptB n=1 Tax=Parvularcula lutaonensis TaxID=491923 RepID=A0ABV7M902_9PROT|nr:LPS export ABC transporter ATP-binding protein [Parvularcula lutaonensis]GGY45330.1 ABC transporter ATP-binding protein [Parvularcula lutaonensis]
MEGSVASKLEGTPAPDTTTGLVAENLQKSYRRRRVVHHVNFRVCRGEVVGLLGPNGAGKTTCFYMVMGLVKADGGTITIDGYDVTGLPMYQRARLGLGYLPQEASIFRGLTVEQNIEAVAELAWPNRDKRKAVIEELLEEFHITHVRNSMATALSGGERRRLEIARALATSPDYMLLDEPFAGIDPLAIADIKALITQLKERGLGVLITDHNVRDTLDIIDRASVIHEGRVLFEGPPDEVISNEDVRRVYLGETYSG